MVFSLRMQYYIILYLFSNERFAIFMIAMILKTLNKV